MFDKKFRARFNSNNPTRPYSLEEVIRMYDNMPSQRVGVLFDLVRWMKKSPENLAKFKFGIWSTSLKLEPVPCPVV